MEKQREMSPSINHWQTVSDTSSLTTKENESLFSSNDQSIEEKQVKVEESRSQNTDLTEKLTTNNVQAYRPMAMSNNVDHLVDQGRIANQDQPINDKSVTDITTASGASTITNSGANTRNAPNVPNQPDPRAIQPQNLARFPPMQPLPIISTPRQPYAQYGHLPSPFLPLNAASASILNVNAQPLIAPPTAQPTASKEHLLRAFAVQQQHQAAAASMLRQQVSPQQSLPQTRMPVATHATRPPIHTTVAKLTATISAHVPPYTPQTMSQEVEFVNSLMRFMGCLGVPFQRLPSIAGRSIPLLNYFQVVTALGGFRQVDATGRWPNAVAAIGFPPAHPEWLRALRALYQTLLYPYEQYFWSKKPVDQIEWPFPVIFDDLIAKSPSQATTVPGSATVLDAGTFSKTSINIPITDQSTPKRRRASKKTKQQTTPAEDGKQEQEARNVHSQTHKKKSTKEIKAAQTPNIQEAALNTVSSASTAPTNTISIKAVVRATLASLLTPTQLADMSPVSYAELAFDLSCHGKMSVKIDALNRLYAIVTSSEDAQAKIALPSYKTLSKLVDILVALTRELSAKINLGKDATFFEFWRQEQVQETEPGVPMVLDADLCTLIQISRILCQWTFRPELHHILINNHRFMHSYLIPLLHQKTHDFCMSEELVDNAWCMLDNLLPILITDTTISMASLLDPAHLLILLSTEVAHITPWLSTIMCRMALCWSHAEQNQRDASILRKTWLSLYQALNQVVRSIPSHILLQLFTMTRVLSKLRSKHLGLDTGVSAPIMNLCLLYRHLMNDQGEDGALLSKEEQKKWHETVALRATFCLADLGYAELTLTLVIAILQLNPSRSTEFLQQRPLSISQLGALITALISMWAPLHDPTQCAELIKNLRTIVEAGGSQPFLLLLRVLELMTLLLPPAIPEDGNDSDDSDRKATLSNIPLLPMPDAAEEWLESIAKSPVLRILTEPFLGVIDRIMSFSQ